MREKFAPRVNSQKLGDFLLDGGKICISYKGKVCFFDMRNGKVKFSEGDPQSRLYGKEFELDKFLVLFSACVVPFV